MATTREASTPVLTAEQITQNPLTIKSTFSIPAKDLLQPRSKADNREILTDVCGLGWIFGVQPLPPSLPDGIQKSIFTAAQKSGRLTIVEPSRQDAIPPSDWTATNLIVRVHFNSSTSVIADRHGINHVSCTLRAPGPDDITRSCDTVSVAATETVTIGTFHYEHPIDYGEGREEDTFVFSFVVEMGSAHRDSKAVPAQTEPRAAMGLAESLRTGCMVDTKFYLYSRKTSEGGASHLKQIYASSAILRGYSDDLDVLLQSRGFKGSETVSLDLFELEDEDQEIEIYDFPDEDSDLEPEEPESNHLPSRSDVDMNELESHNATEAPPIGCERRPATSEDGNGDKMKTSDHELAVALTNVQAVTEKNFMRMGRVIVIKDTAFATWEALIRYIYFKEVHFNNLASAKPLDPSSTVQVRCSPKSMYRLADKFGIQTLKDSALQNIKSQLSVENVTKEVFSRFSSLYPEILNVEIEFLSKNYTDSNIKAGVSEVLQTVVTGKHAERLEALQRIMSDLMAPRTPPPSPPQSQSAPILCHSNVYCRSCGEYHYR